MNNTPCKSGGREGGGASDLENAHGEMQLHLYMICVKDSRGKHRHWLWRSMQDTHNRVLLSLSRDLHLTLTPWTAAAILERTVITVLLMMMMMMITLRGSAGALQ